MRRFIICNNDGSEEIYDIYPEKNQVEIRSSRKELVNTITDTGDGYVLKEANGTIREMDYASLDFFRQADRLLAHCNKRYEAGYRFYEVTPKETKLPEDAIIHARKNRLKESAKNCVDQREEASRSPQ